MVTMNKSEIEGRVMKKLAIITARGGSKRIPRKNIRPFADKPIIEYSINAALESGVFDEIMVSTDDQEIAEVARHAGAKVPFIRSDKTSNDFATTAEVLQEVLDEYRKIGMKFESACCIYPTAPFITGRRLADAMNVLENKQADSVIPVIRFSFPPQRGFVINDGKIEPKWPEYMPMRSQDLQPFYHDAGQFYCFNIESFLLQNTLIMKNTYPIVLSEMEVQDIDSEEDWLIAEQKYQFLKGR
jgi:N-acylneuraminate cytidylyltransferase